MEHNLKWKLFCCTGFRCFGVNLHVAEVWFSVYLALVGQQHVNLSQNAKEKGENTSLTPDKFSGCQALNLLTSLPDRQCTMAHSVPQRRQVVSTPLIEAQGGQAEEREGIPKEEVSFFICTNIWVNNITAIFYALHCFSTRRKIPKYTNQALVLCYRPACISFPTSPINISLGGWMGNENQHRYVLVLLNFLTLSVDFL